MQTREQDWPCPETQEQLQQAGAGGSGRQVGTRWGQFDAPKPHPNACMEGLV